MNILSRLNQLAIKTILIFITSNSMLAQAQEEGLLQHYKTQKPLVLDIRFCSCKALDIESETTAPTLQFLEESNSIKVGTSENDRGFVSSGGLTFAYSITPGKEADSFVLEYSEEYTEGKKSLGSQSVIIIDLDSWVTISGYENISDQGNEYFNVAVKLVPSAKNK